jgi:carbon storage regulator
MMAVSFRELYDLEGKRMLVLTRKANQRVVIGADIEIVVVSISGDRVRLGFVAPKDVSIHREEVQRRIDRELRSEHESFLS